MAKKMKRLSMEICTSMTYDELFKLKIKNLELEGAVKETLESHYHVIRYLKEYFDTSILQISDMNTQFLEDFGYWLKDTRGIKNITINGYVKRIVATLNLGIEKGFIKEDNFHWKRLKEDKVMKEIYTDDELERLLKKPKMKFFGKYRTWVLINFLLGTGVRAKEVRNILIGNLDLKQSMLILTQTKTKTDRYIPISKSLRKILMEYLRYRQSDNPNDYLFCTIKGEQLPRTTMQMAIRNYHTEREVDTFGIHKYRHTFATKCIENGMNPFQLQRILGHSTVTMTQRYVQMSTKILTQNFDNLNPLEQFFGEGSERIKLKK
ncbi:integrase/recombinase XerD [Dethiosulfatibacter aminovorans DSM 17477]|uniref:Integrase/recombinase XerD n=1 Tax=Dethiosulfatibacter aminovorans DSM 17477 TaxID=1121476 RepID=A0A1M6FZ53_9FIRM|nr:site-specific integrase [Dethiosulfatibacter aminovorans]SHJ03035.1 integrase/recombinase XerD [Dethiosulfatibacter aminovorans DSM 17477]